MPEKLKLSTKRGPKKEGYVIDFLEWLLKVAERLLVLALTLAVFVVGLRLLFTPSAEQPAVLRVDWRILPVILIPLFYRPLRDFMEEIVEVWQIKRQKEGTVTIEEEGKPETKQTEVPRSSEEG